MFTNTIIATAMSCLTLAGPSPVLDSPAALDATFDASTVAHDMDRSSPGVAITSTARSAADLPIVEFVKVDGALSDRACAFAREVLERAGAADEVSMMPRKDMDTVVVIGSWGAIDIAEQALSHAVFALKSRAATRGDEAGPRSRSREASGRTKAGQRVTPDAKSRLARVAHLRTDPNLSETERAALALEFRQLLNRIREDR